MAYFLDVLPCSGLGRSATWWWLPPVSLRAVEDDDRDRPRAQIGHPSETTVTEERQHPADEVGSGPEQPGGKRKRWWMVLVASVVLAVLWIGISARHKSATPAAQNQRGGQPIPVETATAQKGDINVYLTGLGTITPLYTVTVHTRVDGQIMRLNYREGQIVHRGDLLVEIDDRPYRVQLTQAEGQLLRDQAALENARVDLARYQELIKRNAVAEQVLATQQALVDQDVGVVKTDQGNIDSAKLNITYCHITAPITGRVGLRLVDPGNIVHAADTNGMLVIAQTQPISAIFTLSEYQLREVLKRYRSGAKLAVDALDRTMNSTLAHGILSTVDNQIDPTTGTLRLRADFDNRDDALFPNEFVNARLLVQRKQNVTLVPSAAVQRNQQETFVYLVKPDHTVTIKAVAVGTVEGGQTEITSGLNPGDEMVTSGVDKLQEGSKVVPHAQGSNPPTQ